MFPSCVVQDSMFNVLYKDIDLSYLKRVDETFYVFCQKNIKHKYHLLFSSIVFEIPIGFYNCNAFYSTASSSVYDKVSKPPFQNKHYISKSAKFNEKGDFLNKNEIEQYIREYWCPN